MNKSVIECVENLMKCRALTCEAEIASFDEALISCAPIVSSLSVNDLRLLIRVFTDDTERPEIMWGLVHLIEIASLQTYAAAVIHEIPFMVDGAKDWAEIILCRLVNAKSFHDNLVEIVDHADPAARETAIIMLQNLQQDRMREPVASNARSVLRDLKAI